MTEQEYTYELQIGLSSFDENHNIKPYVYQELFSQVVARHLNNIGGDFETTSKYNLAWVLVSLSFEIVKPIKETIRLYANTWYSQRRGPFFRREICFKDGKGETVFQGSTYSVLMNLETRTVYRQHTLPFELSEPIAEYTITAEPIYRSGLQYEETEERVIRNSYIDGLGHVNNCRYGEFSYDTLNENELLNFKSLKRIDIYFISELRKNDTLVLYKAYEGSRILVQGRNKDRQNTSFETVMSF